MGSSEKHIVLVAGELSGDMHAAHLVAALKQLDPGLTFSGLGGPLMKAQGVEIYEDLTERAVVGFAEVLKHYTYLKAVFDFTLKEIKKRAPLAVILVDYPGFNLRLAKEIKKYKIPVIYYISPQIWAWKENRVHFIKKYVDLMLVLFPFEETLYQKYKMQVKWVGHPLLDIVRTDTSKEKFLAHLHLDDYKLTIGLLPGSREKEVERHLPLMVEAAEILKKKYPMIQFLMVKAPSIPSALVDPLMQKSSVVIKVVENDAYNAIHACDLCMVASGTATLETAILGKPMVVIYQTSFLTWLLAKMFVKIKNIGLVNVVAGKRIVPECIQFQATPENIAEEMEKIFTNELKIASIKEELSQVRPLLGDHNASQQAAEAVLSFLEPVSQSPSLESW